MKLFIWDFHGTLEKGNGNAVIEITNRILQEAGYEQRMDEVLDLLLSGKKWYEYFAHILPHESEETHLQLQENCLMFQRQNPDVVARHIRANDYAVQVLAAIAAQHNQILISNTNVVDLSAFLNATQLDTFFPSGKYFGRDAHRPDAPRSKKEIAEEYLSGKEFDKIIVIGDSAHDMIPLPNSVTYLYAHEGREFKECAASHKIRDLREVLREV